MTVSVLIPFRSDNGERDRIWSWMRRRWELTMPECELVVCSDGGAPGESFNEGKAWNECARQASGDVFIVGESEVGFNVGSLTEAVLAAQDDRRWRIASNYYALTAKATTQALAMRADSALAAFAAKYRERAFIRESVSPLLVVPREAWDLVGGMDERYEGWGWIDKAFAAAMNTLYRPFERFPGSVFHLFHERDGVPRDCNPELTRRYLAAEGDPDAMRAIIAER